jgi:NadR type nicotinamide-nucleotide adenylyltransferase
LSIKKIVVIGPESTGKSTLSEGLANSLHTVWVPEYARGYLEGLGRDYNETDLLAIAKGQLATEDEQAIKANEYLICDTDLYVVKVWSEAKYGYCHKDILEEIAQRKYDLYLLTYIDVLWTDDPLREHPEPHEREYFYKQYAEIVQNSGVPWVDVHGNEQQRLEQSLNAIKALG